MNYLKGERYDYILIWGHGLKYRDQIINILRSQDFLKIVKILSHRPKTARKLVKAVYSYDYAPFWHLKSKTEYLMQTPKEVVFIFTKNLYPDEDYFGEGEFRHVESKTLKQLKTQLRNKFNNRIDGKLTEDHVIHASDNELQTNFILQYLGFEGLQYLQKKCGICNLPYYLSQFRNIAINEVPIEALVCNIAVGSRFNFKIKTVNLDSSPHYRMFAEGSDVYQEYINTFLGGPITDAYSLERYKQLVEKFEYLAAPYTTNYIATSPANHNKYLIFDGLHRAAIMKHRGATKLPIAILG